MAKPLTVELSIVIRDDIEEVARRTRRSVAFVVRRALAAAKGAPPPPEHGPRGALVLRTDEDDAADTPTRLRAAAGRRPLGDTIEAAWWATRARFHAWAEREEAAAEAERADDLDGALRDAQDPATPAARLAELASSEYPRVRGLVATHPGAPAEVLKRLAGDADRIVREAATARRNP